MHKAKGREFDAVAVVRVQDRLVPYGYPWRGSDEEDEARRLLYVAITRARKVLVVLMVEILFGLSMKIKYSKESI